MINVMCGFDTTNKDVSKTLIFWKRERSVWTEKKNVLYPIFMYINLLKWFQMLICVLFVEIYSRG